MVGSRWRETSHPPTRQSKKSTPTAATVEREPTSEKEIEKKEKKNWKEIRQYIDEDERDDGDGWLEESRRPKLEVTEEEEEKEEKKKSPKSKKSCKGWKNEKV